MTLPTMDPRSEANLAHVHPDLCRIVRAAVTTVPLVVIQGARSPLDEATLVAQHKSQTTHSRHLIGPDGYAHAVDVWPLVDGHADPAKGHEAQVFGRMAQIFQAVAKSIGVPLQWGGADVGAWTPGVVSHFHDYDHFQLPWKEYP